MQNPSIWERLRAFIHQKTAPPEPVKIPSSIWTFLTLIGTTLLTGVCWVMITNTLGWQNNLVATGLIAIFGLIMFSWPLSNWIQNERAKEARKTNAEARLIEDRQKAEALANSIREEARQEKAEAKAEKEAEKEAEKQRRRRGAIRNLYSFLFGDQ